MPHQNMNHICIIVIIVEILWWIMRLIHTVILFLLSPIVMATVPIASPITTSEDSWNDSDTDLSIVNTEDEMHMDLSTWTPAERKRLQHMTEFHEEYQWVFAEKASIRTIIKRRISHMNPPIPKSFCEEEMQNANLEDTNEVITEYITDAHGNIIKKLKPLLIKSEPEREYAHHIHSDDKSPCCAWRQFLYKRGKQQLTHIVNLSPLMKPVMIEL